MNISQKCNCCMHEEVCAKSSKYKEYCKAIVNASSSYSNDFEVNIKCKHFTTKSYTLKRGATE